MQPLIIHHQDPDGFSAAWAANWFFQSGCDCLPVISRNSIPDVTGRNVFIVDFSYSRKTLEEMKTKAASLVLIDHHKTALNELAGFPDVFIDTSKSAGRLTWEYFFPHVPPPWLILYVEDQDLWKFSLDRSRDVNAAINSYPFDLNHWTKLSCLLFHDSDRKLVIERTISELAKIGEHINRYKSQSIEHVLKNVCEIELRGHRVPCINSPLIRNELGEFLSKDKPFAVVWQAINNTDIVFSLRSNDNGIDVEEIARFFGGGGHPKAASFLLSIESAITLLKDFPRLHDPVSS